jgi:nucleotide-binding universal stress UspA family protein
MNRTVAIGYDGSTDAEAALAWGLAFAERHCAAVRIVQAFDPSQHTLRLVGGGGAEAAQRLYESAQQQLTQARNRSKDDHPHLQIKWVLEAALPEDLLIDESRTAETVVIGSRGQSRMSSLLAGSTTLSVAAQAHCTVVAVRSRPNPHPAGHGIVVGTDGSPVAEAAIGFAFQQAAELSTPLTVVQAWTDVMTVGALGSMVPRHDPLDYPDEQHDLLVESLAGWSDKFPEVGLDVRVIRGHAVTTLAAASVDAELLVVGCHGHSVLRGMVLGSVSQGLLHRASVPVAIVHLHD